MKQEEGEGQGQNGGTARECCRKQRVTMGLKGGQGYNIYHSLAEGHPVGDRGP